MQRRDLAGFHPFRRPIHAALAAAIVATAVGCTGRIGPPVRGPDQEIRADQGSMHVDVPLAGHVNVTLNVTAPSSGTTAVRVLESRKSGTVMFRDDGEAFALQ